MYGEKYGINPEEVPERVSVGWLVRWTMLEKAEASREIWKRWEDKGKKAGLSEEEEELRLWAMKKRKY